MLRITTFLTTLTLLVSAHPAGAASGMRWPADGPVVTGFITGSNPYAAGQHRGIDIAAPLGTMVVAPAAGVVSYSAKLPDGGETVTLRANGLLLSHLHLATRSVARGDEVAAGAPLGTVGTTGKRSIEQPHLHFGVRDAATKKYIDPLSVLAPRETPAQIPQASAPAIATPVKKPSAQRAERAERARPVAKQVPRVESPSRPAVLPAAAKPAAAIRAPRHTTSGENLRAPKPMPAVSEAAPDTPRRITTLRPEPKIASGFDPRLPLLALATLFLATLVLRARRRHSIPTPSTPATPQTAAKDSSVVQITRAS